MLPAVSPTGTYKAGEVDLVRGFLVLSHAEVENYVEDIAVAAANRSLETWAQRGRVNRCLAGLLLEHDSSHTPKPQSMSSHINTSVRNFVQYVRRNNHGIKEKNILALFGPLGVDRAEFDTALLADLESLGATRGQVAHSTGRKVQNPPDRNVVAQQVRSVVVGLGSLDALGQTLSKR
jgi:hypothetical protein